MKILNFEEFLNESIETGSFIDRIRYGNPTRELMDLEIKSSKIKDWFINNGLDMEIIQSCPINSSKTTRNEIEELLDKMAKVTKDQLKFAELVDDDLISSWIDFISKLNIKTTREEIQFIIDQTDPLLFYLKNKINRIRPFQLAYYLGKELLPLIHSDANSAAYPSGHGLDSFSLARYFSLKYPENTDDFEEFANRIAISREYVGVHYPSDNEISKKISNLIWDNKLIDIK